MRRFANVFCVAAMFGALLTGGLADAATAPHWVASWIASPTDAVTPIDATGLPVPVLLTNQTVRMIVTPHLGGQTLRLHLSNRFGAVATTFGHVAVGVQGGSSARDLRTATFGGRERITVPAGADVVSDPISLSFDAFDRLAVSIYLPGAQGPPTKHWNANATSWYSPPLSGDLADAPAIARFPLKTLAWLYVDAVDVDAPAATAAIVAFGDSITDGFVAALPTSLIASAEVADRDGRYPDELQRRLDASGSALSVVNAGVAANRLLTGMEPLFAGPAGLQRLRADALDQAGVRGVLLLEGINDLGYPASTSTAAQLIDGYQQAVAAAHAAGKKMWLGTIMPAANALFDGVLLAPQSESYRQQVNAWIRTQQLSDGIVDFDAAVRDPGNPSVLNPAYASPDNVHPNLLGYRVMANAVNLALL